MDNIPATNPVTNSVSATQAQVVSTVVSASAPITAQAVVQPSIFSDLISSLGSTAPVANTIVAVLGHLGLSGSILSSVGAVADVVENASGIDTIVKPVTSTLSELGSVIVPMSAEASAAMTAAGASQLSATGTSAAAVSPNSDLSAEGLAADVVLLKTMFEKIEADVAAIMTRIGL